MAEKIKLYNVGLNKVLDLLYLSSTAYIQLRNNATTKESKTLLTNIANRREQLAQEIEGVMTQNGIQIDKRTWSSSIRAFPPRSKNVDAKSQFETIDKQLLDEYDQVAAFSEATDELIDLFDNHRSNILADLKELSGKVN
ncbi:hypothetical protein [Fulvivirga sp.]|uniref:hypothetical protein n=1 Tax=Fulvivirga sp. TaxID=1931237 RepID=UPI0032EFDB28